MFPNCVYTFKRGDNKGGFCGKPSTNIAFCSLHSFHLYSQHSPAKNTIFSEICYLGDIDKIQKCLDKIPLTQLQINNQLKTCLMSCDSKARAITTVILTSPKYFPETFNYDFTIDPGISSSISKIITETILYKRFLIKLAVKSIIGDLSPLNDLIHRFTMPGCYPRD